jgi:hypothetical protein
MAQSQRLSLKDASTFFFKINSEEQRAENKWPELRQIIVFSQKLIKLNQSPC